MFREVHSVGQHDVQTETRKKGKATEQRNQNTKNGKDEDGEDCSQRTSAGKYSDDSTSCNENESDANNKPTRFVILLT